MKKHSFFYLILLLAVGAIYLDAIAIVANYELIKSDYGKFYNSIQSFFAGNNIYSGNYFLLNEDLQHVFSIQHYHLTDLSTPLMLLMFMPLGMVSYAHSFWLWNLLSILAGLISVFFISRIYYPNNNAFLLVAIAFFLYFPTFLSVSLGQVSLLLLLLLVVIWLAARSNKETLAGLLLGFAISLKIFFGLFLLLFLLRARWRLLLTSLVTMVSVFIATSLVFGESVYLEYVHVIKHVSWYTCNYNASLLSFFSRLFGILPEKNIPLFYWPVVGNCLLLVSLLLVLGMFYWLIRHNSNQINQKQQFDMQYSLAIVVMLLLSPLGWVYYFSFLVLPIICIWCISKQSYYVNGIRLSLSVVILFSSLPQALRFPVAIYQSPDILFWSASYFYSLVLLAGIFTFMKLKETAVITREVVLIPTKVYVLLYGVMLLPSLLWAMKVTIT